MSADDRSDATPGPFRRHLRVPASLEAATAEISSDTWTGYLRLWWLRVRAGDLGSLPIIVGLVVIFVLFGILDDTFLTERNFTNLLLQMATVATIAIGVVFVLLIGEIDLSVAFVSGVGGVVMTLLLRPEDPGWPWWLAIGVALLCTTAIGFLQALVVTKAGVPSFVVTLAGLLIWSGVVLILTTQASDVGRYGSRTRSSSGSPTTSSPTSGDGSSEPWSWAPTRSCSCRGRSRGASAVSRPSPSSSWRFRLRVSRS